MSNSFKKTPKTNVLSISVDWEDVEGKPEGIESAISCVSQMISKARSKGLLSTQDSIAKIKDLINEVIVKPLEGLSSGGEA